MILKVIDQNFNSAFNFISAFKNAAWVLYGIMVRLNLVES